VNVNRGLLNWGLFFIILGAVPLAVQQGWVSHETAANAWRLWPLILVGLGVGLLLHRTPAHFLGGAIVAATFGLLLGGLLAGGLSISSACSSGSGGGPTTTTSDSGTFGTSALVTVKLDCGKLQVQTTPGSGWNLQARDPQGQAPSIDKSDGSLSIQTPNHDTFNIGLTSFTGERNWTIALPTDPQLDEEFDVNAGSATVDLGGAHVGRLSGQFNAADVRVDLSTTQVGTLSLSYNAGSGNVLLPGSSSVTGSIDVNAASLNVCAAPDVGVRVVVSGALHSTNFSGAGLTESGDVWESPNYASATNRADLTLNANAASVTLNPAGGCR
jgi:hypothetical protein